MQIIFHCKENCIFWFSRITWITSRNIWIFEGQLKFIFTCDNTVFLWRRYIFFYFLIVTFKTCSTLKEWNMWKFNKCSVNTTEIWEKKSSVSQNYDIKHKKTLRLEETYTNLLTICEHKTKSRNPSLFIEHSLYLNVKCVYFRRL